MLTDEEENQQAKTKCIIFWHTYIISKYSISECSVMYYVIKPVLRLQSYLSDYLLFLAYSEHWYEQRLHRAKIDLCRRGDCAKPLHPGCRGQKCVYGRFQAN